MTLHDLLYKPWTIGSSDYDWRAAIGGLLDATGSAGAVAVGFFSYIPDRYKYVTIAILIGCAFLGKLLGLQGKPIVKAPAALLDAAPTSFYHTEDRTP